MGRAAGYTARGRPTLTSLYLAHLHQHNFVGVVHPRNNRIAVALVKLNIARHECICCQFESLYLRMRCFDGANQGRTNASALMRRLDAHSADAADAATNDTPA